MKNNKELYCAKLTGNRRDTETLSPKALLIFIRPHEKLERTHCWVDLAMVEHIQPAGHQKPKLISFYADIKEYKRRGSEVSHTLTNITDITLLRK